MNEDNKFNGQSVGFAGGYKFSFKTFAIDAVITLLVIAVLQGLFFGLKRVYDKKNERDAYYQQLIWQLQNDKDGKGKIDINWNDKDGNQRNFRLGGTDQQ